MTNLRERKNVRKLVLIAWIAVLVLGFVFPPAGQHPLTGAMPVAAAEPLSGTEASGDGAASSSSSLTDKPDAEPANPEEPEAANAGTPEAADAGASNATDSGTPNGAGPRNEQAGSARPNGDSNAPEAARGKTESGEETLLIRRDSNVLLYNGKEYAMPTSAIVVNGATYAPARALAERLRLEIKYEAQSKSYLFIFGPAKTELKVTPGESVYIINGTRIQGAAAFVDKKGTLMVPVRVIAQAFGLQMSVDPSGQEIQLSRKVLPVAAFELTVDHAHAGETVVGYRDLAEHPLGLKIVDEEWQGLQERYDTPGTYVITRRVRDENGVWSEPYSVTLEVLPPNKPPHALFTTDKIVYKMGEWIEYRNYSYDDEGRIAEVEWIGAENAFWEPGEKTITLRVTDVHGASSEYTRTITVTDELLYTRLQFPIVYGEPGDKFTLRGEDVPSLPSVSYTMHEFTDLPLFRSNSPELIREDGIYYSDELSDEIRFMLHHQNKSADRKRIWLIATNPGEQPVNVHVDRVSVGGPHIYVTSTGKAAATRYLQALLDPVQPRSFVLEPGESRVFAEETGAVAIQPEQVITAYADVRTDAPVRFSVVVVGEKDDPIARFTELPFLPPDGVHNRGTFRPATRILAVNQWIGGEMSRLVLSDSTTDKWVTGIDMVTGEPKTNSGNYGILYVIRLNSVLPNTGIVVNARGGHYAGAFAVNGQVVPVTELSHLRNPNEAAVLYKTGDQTESVEIVFTPASGSFLPINLLFVPLAPSGEN